MTTLTMKAPKTATLALMFGYLVVGTVVLAWMLSRTNAHFIPDSNLMHDYSRVVAVISLAFLTLSAVPLFRNLFPVLFFAAALLLSGPSLFGKSSVLESVAVYQMSLVIEMAQAPNSR